MYRLPGQLPSMAPPSATVPCLIIYESLIKRECHVEDERERAKNSWGKSRQSYQALLVISQHYHGVIAATSQCHRQSVELLVENHRSRAFLRIVILYEIVLGAQFFAGHSGKPVNVGTCYTAGHPLLHVHTSRQSPSEF